MLGYAMFGTNDPARAAAFYDGLMGVLGVKRLMETPKGGVFYGEDHPVLGVGPPADGQAATHGNGTMLALTAKTRAQVDQAHAKALELGGKDEGAPGIRGDDPNGFYGAYFRDLDGNKLCVFRVGPPD